MVLLGYHASRAQFPPSALLRYARLAEQAGFMALSSSEHLQPWSAQQGHSGYSLAWLGAAMQTAALPCGVVCAPGQRYHPVLIAQAAATLTEMFPAGEPSSRLSGSTCCRCSKRLSEPQKGRKVMELVPLGHAPIETLLAARVELDVVQEPQTPQAVLAPQPALQLSEYNRSGPV